MLPRILAEQGLNPLREIKWITSICVLARTRVPTHSSSTFGLYNATI